MNFRYEQINDSENKQRKQELVELILDTNYGNVISLNTIGDILKLNINDELELIKLKRIVGSLKDFLVTRGKVLRSIKGVGYYILKPKEISGYCYRNFIKKSQRTLDKSMFVLSCTDQTDLTHIQKEEFADMMELNKELIEKVSKTVVESTYFNRKAYYESLQDKNTVI